MVLSRDYQKTCQVKPLPLEFSHLFDNNIKFSPVMVEQREIRVVALLGSAAVGRPFALAGKCDGFAVNKPDFPLTFR
jgi:hypothetical protein